MAKSYTRQEVLDYHTQGRPGKIQIKPTKPLVTQRDLTLAYSPGVAEAVDEITERPLAIYEITAKANLVAVVTNGTAILGLGNRGPGPSKPVMPGSKSTSTSETATFWPNHLDSPRA